MITSMTGFGKGNAEKSEYTAEAEIRSLNGRFLDISVKVPREYQDREQAIRDLVREKVKRGKISVNVSLKKENNNHEFAEINAENFSKVIAYLNKIRKLADIEGDIPLDSILAFQQYYSGENGVTDETATETILKAVKSAIVSFDEMRKQEGAQLAEDLKSRLQLISKAVNKIEELNHNSVVDYFGKLRERAAEIVSEYTEDEMRLNFELALLAEKYDVTEECVRLRSHIKLFENTLEGSQEAGRKLNFISQEMNREANTINSKTISTEISHQGIIIKEELEKIREQIQNIE